MLSSLPTSIFGARTARGLAALLVLLVAAVPFGEAAAQDRPFAHYALSFDGTDDFVRADNDAALETVRSVELWFNAADQVDENSGIVAMRDGATRFSIHVNPGGNTIGLFNGSTFATVTAGGDGILANDWYHLGIVFRAADTQVYLDGALIGAIPHTLDVAATGLPLVVGAAFPGLGEAFAGRIDDVRLWSGELPAFHFQDFRRSTVGKASANLVAYLPFEAGRGDTASEYTRGLDGALTNGPTWTSDDAPIAGPAGALAFDGTDDYVEFANRSELEFATGTVEFYIKPASDFDLNAGVVAMRDGTTRFSIHVNPDDNTLGLWNGSAFNTVTASIDANVWYHVAYVFGATSTDVYLDGALVGTMASTLNAGATGLPLFIGSSVRAGEPFTGAIDEVRLWNTQRSLAQLAAGMGCEVASSEAGLVGYFDFKNDFVASGGDNTDTEASGYRLYERISASNATLSNDFAIIGTTSNWVDQAAPISPLPCSFSAVVEPGLTLYVDADATGANNGSSWADAFVSVQDALAIATGAHEIWIAEGTYYPDEGASMTDNDRFASFMITGDQDGLKVYGGFAGTETDSGQRDWSANPVVLSGEIGLPNELADNSYHVVLFDAGGIAGVFPVGPVVAANLSSATLLDGVTITGGNANGSLPHNSGGGIYCDAAGNDNDCSPTIQNTRIVANQADNFGGGALHYGFYGSSSPTYINVVFAGNSSKSGGAMYNSTYVNAGPSLTNPTIVNSVFYGNTATSSGGAIHNNGRNDGDASPVIINSTFYANYAENNGGAIYNLTAFGGTSNPVVSNTILYGNTTGDNAISDGIQMYLTTVSFPVISHSLIEGGEFGLSSGRVSASFLDETGDPASFASSTNVSDDPLFFDTGDPDGADGIWGTADDGLTLTGGFPGVLGSPALDGGSNDALPADLTTDITGAARINDNDDDFGTEARIDMGAYEAPESVQLPVELSGFAVLLDGRSVRLEWTTSTETGNEGFHVEVRAAGEQALAAETRWDALGFVQGAGTTTEAQTYVFTAEGLDVGRYVFRLRQVDYDGGFAYSPEVEATVGVAGTHEVQAAFPNPFARQTEIRFAVAQAQRVRVVAYDALGREVARLYDGDLEADRTERVVWEASGLASGMYVVLIEGERFREAQRVVVLR